MRVGTKISLAMFAVLSMSILAPGALMVQVDPGVPVDGGLTSYTVRLVASVADDIATAWDGSFDGPMNQLKAFAVLDTPTMTNAAHLGADIVKDSHFLLADDELIIVNTPSESAVQLDGTFAIKPASVGMDLELAQIVIAAGSTVVMSGEAANSAGTKFATNAVIPEPASLSLLILGGLGLIRRRR